MTRARFVSCVVLALAAAACGGNAGSAAPPASGGQAAQPPAAAPANPGAGQSGSAAPTQASSAPAPAAQPAPATQSAPAAIDPAKVTADAADSLAGATATSRAAPASTPAPTTSAAVAPAPPSATPAAPAAVSPEAARRQAQIDWALKQDEIKNDHNGQWAVEAKASSSYNDAQGAAPFSASQATGIPNVETLGNNSMAWATKTPDGGIEWLELKYGKPVFATAVRVRESLGPGAVIKVELFDDKGAPHTVWSGADTTKGLDYLIVEFQKSPYKTERVRLTLATNVVSGWQEIDAVQLVGTDQVVTSTAGAR